MEMTDNNQPETKIMSKQEQLVMRLRRYNEWRRGGEFEQPEPAEIGRDIDDAIALIERYESHQSSYAQACSTANPYLTRVAQWLRNDAMAAIEKDREYGRISVEASQLLDIVTDYLNRVSR